MPKCLGTHCIQCAWSENERIVLFQWLDRLDACLAGMANKILPRVLFVRLSIYFSFKKNQVINFHDYGHIYIPYFHFAFSNRRCCCWLVLAAVRDALSGANTIANLLRFLVRNFIYLFFYWQQTNIIWMNFQFSATKKVWRRRREKLVMGRAGERGEGHYRWKCKRGKLLVVKMEVGVGAGEQVE